MKRNSLDPHTLSRLTSSSPRPRFVLGAPGTYRVTIGALPFFPGWLGHRPSPAVVCKSEAGCRIPELSHLSPKHPGPRLQGDQQGAASIPIASPRYGLRGCGSPLYKEPNHRFLQVVSKAVYIKPETPSQSRTWWRWSTTSSFNLIADTPTLFNRSTNTTSDSLIRSNSSGYITLA